MGGAVSAVSGFFFGSTTSPYSGYSGSCSGYSSHSHSGSGSGDSSTTSVSSTRNVYTPTRPISVLDDGYPTRSLLLAEKSPDLKENKVDGSYNSTLEYLQIHYDLLLEDFMCPLREALNELKSQKQCPDTLGGARVYKSVRLNSVSVTRRYRETIITCVLNIDYASNVHSEKPSFGSLLVFTRGHVLLENMFLGTVISHPKTSQDLVQVKLKMPKDNKISIEELSIGHFITIEAEAFFYVYFHVLKGIQDLDASSFPMRRYIVDGTKETQVLHPRYLSGSTYYEIFGHKGVQVLNTENWPTLEDMDVSQYKALKKALTQEVAVVQGPPGTGKTYFGVRLVKVLLDNIAVWNPEKATPLLLVCQSNQALDNFLGGLLKYSKNFVRVGGQCQSKQIKPYCLTELGCRRYVANGRGYAGSALKLHLDKIDAKRFQIEKISRGVVDCMTLYTLGIITTEVIDLFRKENLYLRWLGFRITRNCNDIDLIVAKEELVNLLHRQQQEHTVDDYMVQCVKEELKKLKALLEDFKKGSREGSTEGIADILSLAPENAQKLYLRWVDAYKKCLENQLEALEEGLRSFWDGLPAKERFLTTEIVLKSAHIVGLTSTGAAARRSSLQALRSPIVIVEEAAEVLESHVVVSMTGSCRHLILLGDHKQLKPGVTTHHLASKFHLNVSLFERLLNNEIVEGSCLTQQYRMRPEISSLLKPHIYQVLLDGPGTENRPRNRGLSKNVFFLDHSVTEQKTDGDKGCWNKHEVEMLIGLSKYLLSSGYSPTDIAIIAMYSEQKRKLIEERDKNLCLRLVEVASVDSYQGREKEIVLLSLVRSNQHGNIGFLKEENRICVALSRARSGLYIMGDMRCLTKRGKFWKHVRERLREQGSIGCKLSLVCEHGRVHTVSKLSDWAYQFCDVCTANRKKKPTASIPSNAVTLPVPVPDSQSLSKTTGSKPLKDATTKPKSQSLGVAKSTRCNCCQSDYCQKLLRGANTDLEHWPSDRYSTFPRTYNSPEYRLENFRPIDQGWTCQLL